MNFSALVISNALRLSPVHAGVILAAVDANSMFNEILKTIMNFVSVGGGFWSVWGAVNFGMALDDQNGPDMKRGIYKIIGGVLVVVASQMFAHLVL